MVNKSLRRTRLNVADRRAQLLSVCLELVGTRSWDSLTMADIAVAAGVSKPLLYHYFSTKNEIYVAAVTAAAADLADATKPDASLPFEGRAAASLRAHIDWIEAHADSYRAILHGGISGNPEVQSIIERSRADVVRRIARAVSGSPPSPTLRIALRGWVGLLEAASLDWLERQDVSKEHLVQLLAASIPATVRTAQRISDGPGAHITTRRVPAGSPTHRTTAPNRNTSSPRTSA